MEVRKINLYKDRDRITRKSGEKSYAKVIRIDGLYLYTLAGEILHTTVARHGKDYEVILLLLKNTLSPQDGNCDCRIQRKSL